MENIYFFNFIFILFFNSIEKFVLLVNKVATASVSAFGMDIMFKLVG